MFYNEEINNDDGTIKVSRLGRDNETVSIFFVNEEQLWDNSSYLFGTLYPILERWESRSLTDDDKDEIATTALQLKEREVKDMLELLREAIKLGWDLNQLQD